MQPVKIIIEWRQLEPAQPVHNFVVQFGPAAKQPNKGTRKRSCRMIDFRSANYEPIPAELAYAAVCREVGCDCGIRLGRN